MKSGMLGTITKLRSTLFVGNSADCAKYTKKRDGKNRPFLSFSAKKTAPGYA